MKLRRNKIINVVFGKKCFVYYKTGKSQKLKALIIFKDEIEKVILTLMRKYGVVHIIDVQNKPIKYYNINEIKGGKQND